MPQQISTSLMQGGLDLVTPAIAMPPGRVISAINYEPDVNGYTSHQGFERFNGFPRPSDSTDPATIAARRGAIVAPTGSGGIRGVAIFDGSVYAWRDSVDGSVGQMFRSTSGGWALQSQGTTITFVDGTAEFVEGGFLSGGTSGASARIQRSVLTAGAWNGTAEGYLSITEVAGTFVAGEILTGGAGGSAKAAFTQEPNVINAGGRVEYVVRNFYGSAYEPRLYFVNSVNVGYEWNGVTLTPMRTGISGGDAAGEVFLLAPNGDFLLAPNGDNIIMSATYDSASFIADYQNHMFLGYTNGAVIFSALGEPLIYLTTMGAGEISFGYRLTGLLGAAATSIMLFGSSRIEYVTGTDADTFVSNTVTNTSGAQPYTAQMMDSPTYLDDGGIRSIDTTPAFGDWRMGSITALVQPLMIAKRDAGVSAVGSTRVRAKDQYKLFWDDGTGVTVYIGRERPEVMPFKIPINITCICCGEVNQGEGDRIFVGTDTGMVYELNRGTSFDGAEIQTYIMFPFTAEKSPSQNTRWMKATFDISSPDAIDIGLKFDVDYGNGLGSDDVEQTIAAGSPNIVTDYFDNITFLPTQTRLEQHIQGIGPNVAATLVTSHDNKRPHTISAQTYNYSRRRIRG